MPTDFPIIDAHLDLAYNAVCRGRDVTLPAALQPRVDNETASVGIPDLELGGVSMVCATIFVEHIADANDAWRQARQQLAWYQSRCFDGVLRLVNEPAELPGGDTPSSAEWQVAAGAALTGLPFILLMEGADPIRNLADVQQWFNAGVRMVGLSWRKSRYAGGTGHPGPITAEGVTIVKALDAVGMIHDASHLAEESFWQLLDLSAGPVVATHSNCRAIVDGDRHLNDAMIRAIASRGGVIGINFFDRFILPAATLADRRATLGDLVTHIDHICQLAGDASHVGIGTDMDGGLGQEHIPQEITTAADLPKVGDALQARGYKDADIAGILGENWLRFFERHLPSY